MDHGREGLKGNRPIGLQHLFGRLPGMRRPMVGREEVVDGVGGLVSVCV